MLTVWADRVLRSAAKQRQPCVRSLSFAAAAAVLAIAARLVALIFLARSVTATRIYIPFRSSGKGTATMHIQEGVSIVTACTRTQKAALESWLRVTSVDEVVVVDWAPPAAHDLDFTHPRVRIVRVAVTASPDYIWNTPPSSALNLAVALARYETVVRVECPFPLETDFIQNHRHAKFWRENGVTIVTLNTFVSVNGYDERLIPSAVDADLSRKLDFFNLLRTDENARYACGDSISRVLSNLRSEAEAMIADDDRAARGYSPPLTYQAPAGSADVPTVLAVTVNEEISTAVQSKTLSVTWLSAVSRELHDSYGITWDFIYAMNSNARDILLRNLLVLQRHHCQRSGLPRSTVVQLSWSPPRILVVHAMHGLGNRLRTLASAMAFAVSTGRQLVIVWERDQHCNAFFSDLFESTLSSVSLPRAGHDENLVVVDKLPLQWTQFHDASKDDVMWRDWVTYNYMSVEGNGAFKDQEIEDQPSKHMYWKSAYVMQLANRKLSGWDLANEQLRRLRPVLAVRSLISSAESKLKGAVAASTDSFLVGVHIRSLSLDKETGIDALREYGRDDTEVLAYWRNQSRADQFWQEMQRLVYRDPSTVFFLASDSASVVADANHLFRTRLHTNTLPSGPCDSNRGLVCLQVALADMIVLSRTRNILGSPWSSFTEVAQRFGGAIVRLAGVDFGSDRSDKGGELPPAVDSMLSRIRRKKATRNVKEERRQRRGRLQPP
jgi:hypothetical protein